jgi:AraC-like DNA-binding protein
VMIAGIILGTFFILFTATSRRGKEKVVVFLNLFLLFLTLNNLQITLVDNEYIVVNFFVRKLLIPWYALIMPMFYTFLIHYLKIEKRVTPLLRYFMGLFVLEIAIRLVFISLYYPDKEQYVVAKYAQIEEMVNAFFSIVVLVKSFVLVFKYDKLFAYVLTFDNLKWIKTLLFLGSISILLWVCAIVMNLDKVLNPEIYIYYPLRLSCSIILYWLGYQGFFNFSLMTERIELRKVMLKNKKTQADPKYDIEQKDTTSFEQLNQFIIQSELFLDPHCNINTIASAIEMTPKKISDCVKSNTDGNFPDHINQMRVQKSKKYLSNSDYHFYTIESIGLECGFNSKSAFYTSFKKFTNQTPTEFRNQN